MLTLLRIRNFAIIDELELELKSGFNVITGETGAGKSIILEALGLILGNRANTDIIRSGSDEATVEAVFDVTNNEILTEKLKNFGIKIDHFNFDLLIKRTIHRNGRNKIFLNNELITLSQLGEVCDNLIELCSQHEHQSLSKSIYQLDLLDRYGGLLQKKLEISEVFSALKSLESELHYFTSHIDHKINSKDFLNFQLKEINDFAPKESEEAQLLADRKKLVNSNMLLENSTEALRFLSEGLEGDVKQNTVILLLHRAMQKLIKACDADEQLQSITHLLKNIQIETNEAVELLHTYIDKLEVDPNKLEDIEERITQWNEMKRKYGHTYEHIMTYKINLEKELDEFEHQQEKRELLQEKINSLNSEYKRLASSLSKKRKNIAKTLQISIQNELKELMMPEVQIKIELEESPWSADGCDRLQFLFSPNPGEDLKPIAKIASGGELSRILLTLRRTIADRGGIGVYLFDEIDSGMSGQTASVVGKKLKSVSQFNQILCITHLPQVAAYANTHFLVSKSTIKGRTISKISSLNEKQRTEELARMLGGLTITEKSRAHAKELLIRSSDGL